MALLASRATPCLHAAAQRRSVVAHRPLKVSAIAANGAQSKEDMNKAIGANIKRAAAKLGAVRVSRMNKDISKYIATAAEQAAAGKLGAKAPKTTTAKK